MEDCRNEINTLIAEIDSEWTLEQILKCIKNLTDCKTTKKEYKQHIIEMIDRVESEKFLRQIYSLIYFHLRDHEEGK